MKNKIVDFSWVEIEKKDLRSILIIYKELLISLMIVTRRRRKNLIKMIKLLKLRKALDLTRVISNSKIKLLVKKDKKMRMMMILSFQIF